MATPIVAGDTMWRHLNDACRVSDEKRMRFDYNSRIMTAEMNDFAEMIIKIEKSIVHLSKEKDAVLKLLNETESKNDIEHGSSSKSEVSKKDETENKNNEEIVMMKKRIQHLNELIRSHIIEKNNIIEKTGGIPFNLIYVPEERLLQISENDDIDHSPDHHLLNEFVDLCILKQAIFVSKMFHLELSSHTHDQVHPLEQHVFMDDSYDGELSSVYRYDSINIVNEKRRRRGLDIIEPSSADGWNDFGFPACYKKENDKHVITVRSRLYPNVMETYLIRRCRKLSTNLSINDMTNIVDSVLLNKDDVTVPVYSDQSTYNGLKTSCMNAMLSSLSINSDVYSWKHRSIEFLESSLKAFGTTKQNINDAFVGKHDECDYCFQHMINGDHNENNISSTIDEIKKGSVSHKQTLDEYSKQLLISFSALMSCPNCHFHFALSQRSKYWTELKSKNLLPYDVFLSANEIESSIKKLESLPSNTLDGKIMTFVSRVGDSMSDIIAQYSLSEHLNFSFGIKDVDNGRANSPQNTEHDNERQDGTSHASMFNRLMLDFNSTRESSLLSLMGNDDFVLFTRNVLKKMSLLLTIQYISEMKSDYCRSVLKHCVDMFIYSIKEIPSNASMESNIAQFSANIKENIQTLLPYALSRAFERLMHNTNGNHSDEGKETETIDLRREYSLENMFVYSEQNRTFDLRRLRLRSDLSSYLKNILPLESLEQKFNKMKTHCMEIANKRSSHHLISSAKKTGNINHSYKKSSTIPCFSKKGNVKITSDTSPTSLSSSSSQSSCITVSSSNPSSSFGCEDFKGKSFDSFIEEELSYVAAESVLKCIGSSLFPPFTHEHIPSQHYLFLLKNQVNASQSRPVKFLSDVKETRRMLGSSSSDASSVWPIIISIAMSMISNYGQDSNALSEERISRFSLPYKSFEDAYKKYYETTYFIYRKLWTQVNKILQNVHFTDEEENDIQSDASKHGDLILKSVSIDGSMDSNGNETTVFKKCWQYNIPSLAEMKKLAVEKDNAKTTPRMSPTLRLALSKAPQMMTFKFIRNKTLVEKMEEEFHVFRNIFNSNIVPGGMEHSFKYYITPNAQMAAMDSYLESLSVLYNFNGGYKSLVGYIWPIPINYMNNNNEGDIIEWLSMQWWCWSYDNDRLYQFVKDTLDDKLIVNDGLRFYGNNPYATDYSSSLKNSFFSNMFMEFEVQWSKHKSSSRCDVSNINSKPHSNSNVWKMDDEWMRLFWKAVRRRIQYNVMGLNGEEEH